MTEPLDLRAVEARIAEIEADSRYQSGLQRSATVFENAPLALIQMGFEQELLALKQLALPVVAHARALRLVLIELAWSMGKLSAHRPGCITFVQSDAACTCGLEQLERAAAVLGAAQDGPA